YERITWNPKKAAQNLRKHGVSFDEAREVLDHPLTRVVPDLRHSRAEDRYFAIGDAVGGHVLAIAYTIRDDSAWIISARRATPSESRSYMTGRDIIRDRPIDDDEDPLDQEIDFSNAKPIGRKFAKLRMSVVLDTDVCDVFRTADEVNNALRMLIREGRVPHLNYR
ncbi:MAG TPA: BrnT family toxin, partial [Thermoanaerobaculia bacterium]|nr:BrnT family toxin [Thermoanaerobaculia bacterium]